MRAKGQSLSLVDATLSGLAARGALHRYTEDRVFDGRTVTIDGRRLLFFGSCSYLGLELHPEVKRATIAACERYGTELSSSRAYLSCGLYRELETLLARIFGAHVLVCTTTTLGHLSALPILVEDDDVLLLDQQVHHSVALAANQVRRRATVDVIPHSRLDVLEQRLEEAAGRRRIWYAADGVYSMYGDAIPMDRVLDLLDRYPDFHVYVDDAHGVSWAGPNGRGVALAQRELHPRMVVATTLGKSFGAGGAVVLFPDAESCRRVRTCGGPMIFGGPIPPPILGAATASARIHLSPEIRKLQAQLDQRMRYCNDLLASRGLPLVSRARAPVRFIGLGEQAILEEVFSELLREGFFTNVASFPAVPQNRCGIRFTLTTHLALEDIEALVSALHDIVRHCAARAGTSIAEIQQLFDLPTARPTTRATPGFTLSHTQTIESISPREWDRCLGHRGTFNHAGCRFLEHLFVDRERPEQRGVFHYYVVRGSDGTPVVATFFTEALFKDDMLAPAEESAQIEPLRAADPYYKTSRVLSMGSLLTEGDHLYYDRGAPWRGGLELLLEHAESEAVRAGAGALILRDLPEGDTQLAAFLGSLGFERERMPQSLVVDIAWTDRASFLESLTRGSRRIQRRYVLPHEESYTCEVLAGASGRRPRAGELAHFYALYTNVRDRALALNTFALPEDVFEVMLAYPGWEFVVLTPREEICEESPAPPAAVVACWVTAEHYAPTLLGMDYRYVERHGLYRQSLWRCLERARELGIRTVRFGMGAEVEKRRFGARSQGSYIYVRPVEG